MSELKASSQAEGVASSGTTGPAKQGARRDSRSRSRWAIAVSVALLVHAGAFLAWRVPTSPGGPAQPGMPRISLASVSGSAKIGDELELFDSAPLFLPTKWNYATTLNALKTDRSPGEIFDRYPYRRTVEADPGPADLVAPPSGVADAASALKKFDWPYFEAFGQMDRPKVSLPERLALMEVRSISTGQTVLTREIPVDAAPNAKSWGFWVPLEFLVAVESTGLLGPPELASGSTFEDVDSFFRGYLQRDAQLGLRVPAGYYRVRIGP